MDGGPHKYRCSGILAVKPSTVDSFKIRPAGTFPLRIELQFLNPCIIDSKQAFVRLTIDSTLFLGVNYSFLPYLKIILTLKISRCNKLFSYGDTCP